MLAVAIKKRRLQHRSLSQWRWHLDEFFIGINCEMQYFWRSVGHEDEALEVFATMSPGLKGCADIPEAHNESLWPTAIYRNRLASVVPIGK